MLPAPHCPMSVSSTTRTINVFGHILDGKGLLFHFSATDLKVS